MAPSTIAQLTSDRIQATLYAFMQSQILFTALDLDIFTRIARGESTCEGLATALSLDARGLGILLNGLVGMGFLTRLARGGFGLSPDAANFLDKESDAYMGGMVHHCKRLYENWSLLTDAVRTGQPVGGAQSLAQLETYFSELVKGLYVTNYPTAKKLAAILKTPALRADAQVLDVAGGSAVWSIALMEALRLANATVIDFPSVIHVAEAYVHQHSLQERFAYWPGDLEDYDFPADCFDIAVMANICHTLGPVSTQRAFEKLAKTLRPGGKLAIVDFVPDVATVLPTASDSEKLTPKRRVSDQSQTPTGSWPLVFGVNMLITTPEGNVYTVAEYTQWLKAAGFDSINFRELEPDVTAIIATRA